MPDAKKMMRVLGIDCGSRVTGYGVIDNDGAECFLVRCGAIRSKASDPLPTRLRSIHNAIVDIIRDLCPEAAALESLFYATNVQLALTLSDARGVSIFAAVESNLRIFGHSRAVFNRAVS